MDTTSKTKARAVLAGLIVLALLVPAVALAGPGARKPAGGTGATASATATPKGKGSQPQTPGPTAKGQPTENLKRRIDNVLRARAKRFDTAADVIAKRIARVSLLADKVEAAGGDVSKVRTALAEASAALAEAKTLEAAAVAKFQAVPEATDRKAAFRDAKAAGKVATKQLKVARAKLIEGVHALREATQALEP